MREIAYQNYDITQKLSAEMLKKTVCLAKQIRDDEQRVQALAGLLTFSDKFINADDAREIKEEIRMNKVTKLIFDEGMEHGIECGLERGIMQGEKQKVIFLIRKKLNKNMSQREIAEQLEEKEANVERIIFLIKNYPDADDQKICEMMLENA